MLPKVTYDWDEFIEFNEANQDLAEYGLCGLHEKYLGWYSEYGGGCIWLASPSKITLLHELLHHIGFNLKLPHIWHDIIERII